MNAYSKIPRVYEMENITTEEVMENIDMFKVLFVKVDEFGWWDMERIQTDADMKFTSNEFGEGIFVHVVRLELAAPDHQEMNGRVKGT